MKLFTEIGLPKPYYFLFKTDLDASEPSFMGHICQKVDAFSILYGSQFEYCVVTKDRMFALEPVRNPQGEVVGVNVQEVIPLGIAPQPEPEPELQKLYTIDVTRHDKKTGEIYARYDLGLVPMTHKEACTLISKQSNHAGRGFILVEFPRTDGLMPDLA